MCALCYWEKAVRSVSHHNLDASYICSDRIRCQDKVFPQLTLMWDFESAYPRRISGPSFGDWAPRSSGYQVVMLKHSLSFMSVFCSSMRLAVPEFSFLTRRILIQETVWSQQKSLRAEQHRGGADQESLRQAHDGWLHGRHRECQDLRPHLPRQRR